MAIENLERDISKIYEELGRNKLVLPNFQRGFVWDRQKQKQLLASTLVGLPVGSLLTLEGDKNDFTKRELCFPDPLEINQNCEYVLDGQQRLSTLRTIFYDIFETQDWKEVWDRLYGSLRNRWFIRVRPDENESDIFGFNKLNFTGLANLTDGDVIDYLEVKQIRKTRNQDVHNPGFKPLDANGNEIRGVATKRNAIASKYSDECIVPLFEIYKKGTGIHRVVLQKIADSRVDELKALAEDSESKLDFFWDYFAPISSSISKEDVEAELERLDSAPIQELFTDQWAQLKSQWVEKFSNELEGLLTRKLSIVHLDRDEIERAVAIFEAINRGGEPLTVYDLVVAKSARNSGVQNLSSHIIEELHKHIEIDANLNSTYSQENTADRKVLWSSFSMDVITGNEPSKQMKEWFVNVLSLLNYVKENDEPCKVEHIKREKILSVTSSEINGLSDRVITAILRALVFLQLRCGVCKAKDLPYKLMLIVLAYHLDDDGTWNDMRKIDLLEYWYWTSLFSGAYFYRQNERCIEDLLDLGKLISTNDNPFSSRQGNLFNFQDYLSKEILLREDENGTVEPSTARNAILQFILSTNPYDFSIDEDNNRLKLNSWDIAAGSTDVELHHIVPLGNVTTVGQTTAELRGDENHVLNSPLNLAYISKAMNQKIREKSPAQYLQLVDEVARIRIFIPRIELYEAAFKTNDYAEIMRDRYDKVYSSVVNHTDRLLRG